MDLLVVRAVSQFPAGALRNRVRLQQNTTTQDSTGMPVSGWADIATVWGSIEPLDGRELIQAGQVAAEVNTRIRIRYRAGLDAKMRVLTEDGARAFEIHAIIQPELRTKELELLCLERPGASA